MTWSHSVFLGLLVVLSGCGGPAAVPKTPASVPGGNGVSYSGGDGLSCESRIVVHAPSEDLGVPAEYAWLRKHYPRFRAFAQALIECDGKPADRLDIRSANGQELSLYFDISSFFGKM